MYLGQVENNYARWGIASETLAAFEEGADASTSGVLQARRLPHLRTKRTLRPVEDEADASTSGEEGADASTSGAIRFV
jgi:hypothetical protein